MLRYTFLLRTKRSSLLRCGEIFTFFRIDVLILCPYGDKPNTVLKQSFTEVEMNLVATTCQENCFDAIPQNKGFE
jgi:hypothetical protein